MFDIGFWELVAIAVIALLIIGPEKLPGFARDAGRLFRKARNFAQATKRELEKELELDRIDGLNDEIRRADRLFREAPDRFLRDTEAGAEADPPKTPAPPQTSTEAKPKTGGQ